MSIIGILCYLISFSLLFWVDWRLGLALVSFYIAFKIEIYDYRELSND